MSGRQLTRAELVGMTADEIVSARRSGALTALLGGGEVPVVPDSLPRVAQLSRADLAALNADQVVEARRAGRLAQVLGGTAPVEMSQLPPVGAA